LWKRKDKDKVNSLAAWEMVCKPKKKGCLGIINMQVQNTALLLKHLDKFYNNEDIPWVHLVKDAHYQVCSSCSYSLWLLLVENIIKLSDEYRSITSVKIGNGSSALFWSDLWKNGILDVRFSRLFSFAKDMFQSVKEFLKKIPCWIISRRYQIHPMTKV
jgi:hypothetical protein